MTYGAFVGQLVYSMFFLQDVDGESCLCALYAADGSDPEDPPLWICFFFFS